MNREQLNESNQSNILGAGKVTKNRHWTHNDNIADYVDESIGDIPENADVVAAIVQEVLDTDAIQDAVEGAETAASNANSAANTALSASVQPRNVTPSDSPNINEQTVQAGVAGTYTNFGGVVVSSGDLTSGNVQLRLTGSTWGKFIIPISLGSYVNKTTDIEYTTVVGKNIFNKTKVEVGAIDGNTGANATSATSRRSEYIAVEPNTAYTISGRTAGFTLAFYDQNKVVDNPSPFGANWNAGAMNGTYTTKSTTRFIRFIAVLAGVGNVDVIQLEKGATATAYEPYTETTYVAGIDGKLILPPTITIPSRVFNNQAVKFKNGVLTIISKYDSTRNIKTTMQRGLANNLFCIKSTELISSNGFISEDDFNKGGIKQILKGDTTDLIGPYILNFTNFVSGNHDYVFDTVRYKTANQLSQTIYVDGIELIDSDSIYDARVVTAIVKTEVYNYTTIAAAGHLAVVDFNEYHHYKIERGGIEAIIEQVAVRNCSFSRLYGIQNVVAGLGRIYVAHSLINTVQTFNNAANYGNQDVYPNVEKAIYTDNTSSDCVSVWVDLSRGLGLNKTVRPTTKAYHVATTKGYHWLIDNTRLLNIGEKMFYRGGYYPFKNLSTDPNVFAYIQKDGVSNDTHLIVDFARTETDLKSITIINSEFIGKVIEVVSKDSTISIADLFVLGEGLTVQSVGYGNIKILIK